MNSSETILTGFVPMDEMQAMPHSSLLKYCFNKNQILVNKLEFRLNDALINNTEGLVNRFIGLFTFSKNFLSLNFKLEIRGIE